MIVIIVIGLLNLHERLDNLFKEYLELISAFTELSAMQLTQYVFCLCSDVRAVPRL